MVYRAFSYVAVVLIAANFGQIQSLLLRNKNLMDLQDDEVVSLRDPSEGENSALVLSHDLSYMEFRKSTINYEKTVTLSAPEGYALFVSFRKIDFRPNSVDTLTLSVPGTSIRRVYTNSKSSQDPELGKEDGEQFYSPTGKIQVSFKTVNADMFMMGYSGFEFTCTVQGNVNKPETCKTDFFKCQNGRCIASALACNEFAFYKYQHCGDNSDHTFEICTIDQKIINDICKIYCPGGRY